MKERGRANLEMLIPFLVYVVLIAGGLAFYIVVGLTHH
jgi:hypothetical protein